MSYHNHSKVIARRRKAVSGIDILQSALGGASDCGPNQQWDPNFVYPGLPPGQCTPKGSAMTPAPGGGSGGSSWTDALTAGLTSAGKIFGQQQPGVIMAPQTGISTTTIAVLGIGMVGLVLLLTRK